MRRRAIVFGAAALMAAAAAIWTVTRPEAPGAALYAAPDLEPMTAETAASESYRLAPALLLVVYRAFGETSEAAIYDTLAEAAAGDALEALYLERAGAMVGGGLTESDQTIHEMRMKEVQTTRSGSRLAMQARWEVIGLVGHSEHQHVRGNTYSATLAVAPVDGAWKITEFALRDVDRSAAGELTEAETAAGGDGGSWWN